MTASFDRDGQTNLELPPLGRISAGTPAAPVAVSARVDAVDIDALQNMLDEGDPLDRLEAAVRRDLPGLLRHMALRSLVVAAVVGAAAAALLPRRRWWHALAGSVAALAAVGALGGIAWARFDVEAFSQPSFQGALERAPSIVEAASRHVSGLRGVEDRVDVLGTQLADLYAETAAVDIGRRAAGETRILHVSDLHSNPLGFELVQRLATTFQVDAVLDTGDLTSFGFAIEGRVAELIAEVPVPYLFVPGNHDSDQNRATIGAIANVELLDGNAVTVGDMLVMGVADPTFTASNETSADEARSMKRRAAPGVARTVRSVDPDVFAVHDLNLAGATYGAVPLVLGGHTHRRSEAVRHGTTVLTVGSTGAGGLGSFTVETSTPYEAQVLRFRDRALVAVDYVVLQGISGDFTVTRTQFGTRKADESPAPSTTTSAP